MLAPGSVVCIRNQGMPTPGKFGDFGDLYVHFKVLFPSRVTDQQKSLMVKAFGLPPPPPPVILRDDDEPAEPLHLDNPKIIRAENFADLKENKAAPENGVDCATQ